MIYDGPPWERDFPLRDEVEDFSGKIRKFVITCHEVPLGFTVRAEEEGTDGEGYMFAAYSETSPYSALGRVRQKMQRALATRHLSSARGAPQMLHDQLRGRITCDAERGVLLVVDGIPIEMDQLARILETHEGFDFELRIKSGLA